MAVLPVDWLHICSDILYFYRNIEVIPSSTSHIIACASKLSFTRFLHTHTSALHKYQIALWVGYQIFVCATRCQCACAWSQIGIIIRKTHVTFFHSNADTEIEAIFFVISCRSFGWAEPKSVSLFLDAEATRSKSKSELFEKVGADEIKYSKFKFVNECK